MRAGWQACGCKQQANQKLAPLAPGEFYRSDINKKDHMTSRDVIRTECVVKERMAESMVII